MFQHPRGLAARTLGVLSVVLAVVLTTGSGAFAASKTVRDTTGDTYSVAGDTPVRASSAIGDIVSVRTTHRARTVVVVVRARDQAGAANVAGVQIRTANRGRDYNLVGMAGGGMKMVDLSRGANGKSLTCRGLRMAFKVAQNTVRAEIPRSCLGNPRWVRTGVMLMSSDTGFASDEDSGFLDVAGLDVVTPSMWNDDDAPLPFGPKVRRG
jgi:hypothetical protein